MTTTPAAPDATLRAGLALRPMQRPVIFITGCGRSGTTILGETLSRHPDIYYINDRFDIWVRPFPKTDVWGKRLDGASAGSARIGLTADDADSPAAALRFREILNALCPHRPVLVEKLAINNFRIGFLRAVVPEARFVNILRHGVEVAFSIAARAEAGAWYGAADRKWHLLIEHAVLHGYSHLIPHVKTPYERGLLEWRMSVEWAERETAALGQGRLLRLRYEELIADPVAACDRLIGFLGLPESDDMRSFAAGELRRQNPGAAERPAPPGTGPIAGETLRRLGYDWTPEAAGARA
ncbi:MAG: sulfotransferase [Phycisphaerales bacterium]